MLLEKTHEQHAAQGTTEQGRDHRDVHGPRGGMARHRPAADFLERPPIGAELLLGLGIEQTPTEAPSPSRSGSANDERGCE